MKPPVVTCNVLQICRSSSSERARPFTQGSTCHQWLKCVGYVMRVFEYPVRISGRFGCSKSIIWKNVMPGKMDEWLVIQLFSLNKQIKKMKRRSALGIF